MKIVTIVGARPQFIKAAPVSRALARQSGIDECIVHTGQHYDANMSDVFFDELSIPVPTHHLGIGGMSHGANTGRTIEAIETVLLQEKPDWVMVYGDTNSTLAGALAAAKLHIPIAHVEAGLRSFNMRMPEEVNRRLTDHCSSLLFTPCNQADMNLRNEGISGAHVCNVGDVMYDAVLMFGDAVDAAATQLEQLGVERGKYLLATIHRQENTDDKERMVAIMDGLGASPYPVLLPLHPRTRGILASLDLTVPSNVHIVDPLGYLQMLDLERNAALVVTDSGGVQKEAYFHRVPCITLRDETEWTELVELGWNQLASPSRDDLRTIIAAGGTVGREDILPYGDGTAAHKIARALAGL